MPTIWLLHCRSSYRRTGATPAWLVLDAAAGPAPAEAAPRCLPVLHAGTGRFAGMPGLLLLSRRGHAAPGRARPRL
eukprot:10131091-Alexandrium_andersonii.AAC.1